MASSSTPLRRVPVLIPDYMQEKLLEEYRRAESSLRGIGPGSIEVENRQRQEEFLRFTHGERDFTQNFPSVSVVRGIASFPKKQSRMNVWDCTPHLVLSNYAETKPKEGAVDEVAQSCYESMYKIDRFFRDEFQRPPVLNANELMTTVVHNPLVINNCFWNSGYEAVFMGEWDTRYFNPPIRDLSIITHEFGHAVTHYSSGLQYIGETGALNEAVSDIFAIMHQHRQANVRADSREATWVISENLIKNRDGSFSPLRSMSNPGEAFKGHRVFGDDQQVGHTRDMDPQKWPDYRDHGGVHVYSGIPNRAFYLMSTRMGGPSWEKPGQIWFNTLMKAQEDDDFLTFANRTCEQTRLLYDVSTQEIVAQAWKDVGVELRKLKSSTPSTSTPLSTQKSSFSYSNVVICGVAVATLALGVYLWTRPHEDKNKNK